MKKTILTTAILFSLLSCSKDENNGGSGSKCLNYRKMWLDAYDDKSDAIQRQNEIQAQIKKPYRYDSAKMQFTKDSARIYHEAIATGCEAYF